MRGLESDHQLSFQDARVRETCCERTTKASKDKLGTAWRPGRDCSSSTALGCDKGGAPAPAFAGWRASLPGVSARRGSCCSASARGIVRGHVRRIAGDQIRDSPCSAAYQSPCRKSTRRRPRAAAAGRATASGLRATRRRNEGHAGRSPASASATAPGTGAEVRATRAVAAGPSARALHGVPAFPAAVIADRAGVSFERPELAPAGGDRRRVPRPAAQQQAPVVRAAAAASNRELRMGAEARPGCRARTPAGRPRCGSVLLAPALRPAKDRLRPAMRPPSAGDGHICVFTTALRCWHGEHTHPPPRPLLWLVKY